MQVLMIRRHRVTQSGLLLALFFLAFVLTIQVRGIERRFLGVKPGVVLADRAVGGFLPGEVTRLVKAISPAYECDPQNAMLYSETGQVIGERAGVAVDIDGTVRAVCQAKPRERVQLITHSIPAVITKEYFVPVFRGPRDRPEVALAINVAWGEESLPGMLATLQKEDTQASFFFVGDWVRKFPELVQAVASAGHEIGNHGLYHGHPCSLTRDELSRLILDNAALLANVLGRPPVPLFAPPSGEFDRRTVGIAAELGHRTILWTVDTVDWKLPSPESIRTRITGKVCNGAIILMHPTAPTSAALPGVIADMRAKGFKIVTVGQLLAAGKAAR